MKIIIAIRGEVTNEAEAEVILKTVETALQPYSPLNLEVSGETKTTVKKT